MILRPVTRDALRPVARSPLERALRRKPSVSPTLARIMAAAAAAPASVADIPTAAGVTPTYGAPNVPPPIFNGEGEENYQRHWFSGAGKNNGGGGTDNARLSEVAFCFNSENWGYQYGAPGVTINFNDGSKADSRTGYWGFGSGRPYIGFKTNSRHLSIAGQYGSQFRLQVNGEYWPYSDPLPNNNCYLNYDFLTSEEKFIVISGQADGSCFFSDICIETGATIEPYDFLAERGGLILQAVGDSYQAYNAANIGFMEMIALMLGFAGLVETGRGSTGYQRNNGEVGWAAVEMERQAFVAANPCHALLVQLAINDSIPRDLINPGGTNPDIDALDAIEQTILGYRAAHPSALLLLQGAWAPNQVNAQNPGSKYQQFMDKITAVARTLPGEVIVLNNLFGGYETSKGKTRPTLRGAWQSGTGSVTDPKGDGNGDTWVQDDKTHPTTPVGITGLSQLVAGETKLALATF